MKLISCSHIFLIFYAVDSVGSSETIEVRPPNQTGSSGAPQLLDEAGKGFNVMGEAGLSSHVECI
ncbi:unnamed protein product [Cladocopium goreaui]|uniref:Uncharacterized protein n=1 Tax=Cladocopium goreaui TaxID=2562237 RepID=A0A9P1D6N2_9DINO|nr:unnamed protein product [Cladocopium goreaui]